MLNMLRLLFYVVMVVTKATILAAQNKDLHSLYGSHMGAACIHPQLCVEQPGLEMIKKNETTVILALENAVEAVKSSYSDNSFLKWQNGKKPNLRKAAALRDCIQLHSNAIELLQRTRQEITTIEDNARLRDEKIWNIHTWISAALTHVTTCEVGNKDARSNTEKQLSKLLALISIVYERKSSSASSVFVGRNSYPRWLKEEDTKLLQQWDYSSQLVADAIVAKDGSGNFSSIQAAIAAAPVMSNRRYIIYIRQGTYQESFDVPSNKPFIMLVGDGAGKTIITASKSIQDPSITTFTSATVAIDADRFLARDLTIANKAGPRAHQAVALRVAADWAAFFRCTFEGYQDTLYVHSFRQFFRDCSIYGTVDFVFGNAAALFQDSSLIARVPLNYQENTITAQGRTDPNQNTGLVFQGCTLKGVPELQSRTPTYLGRPWKEYSLTVFLYCHESIVINPKGWLPWNGDFALNTLFYAEYLCDGPGAQAAARVPWSTQITSSKIANNYTAINFIDGAHWLSDTTFPFDLSL